MGEAPRRNGWRAATLAGLIASLASAQVTDPLAPLVVEEGKLGWDGLDLGTSLVKAERLSETTLALSERGERPVCSRFAADTERGGLNLVLGFPTAKPGAKIESIWVQFEGHQVAASAADLAASLRAKLPGAAYLPNAAKPELTEAEDPRPTYLVPGDPPSAIRFFPRNGVLLARRECLG